MTCHHCGVQLREVELDGTNARRLLYECRRCGAAYEAVRGDGASADRLVELPRRRDDGGTAAWV